MRKKPEPTFICPVCSKESILSHSHRALFVDGERICATCEFAFKRTRGRKLPADKRERAHNRDWKRFIAGDLYPEISVTITTAAGSFGRLAKLPKVGSK